MKFISACAAVTAALCFSQASRASDAATQEVVQELCEGGAAEGAYSAVIGRAGKFRIYLVCTGAGSIAATMRDGMNHDNETVSNQITLVYNAVDDDTLSFVTFHGEGEDISSIPATGDGRLQVSIAALKNGELKGNVRFLRMIAPVAIHVSREATFPVLLPHPDPTRGINRQVTGVYKATDRPRTSKFVPDVISIDVIGGIQRGILNFSDPNIDTAFALYNGVKAAEAGDVFYVTSGVDDGDASHATLQHIRGRVTGPDEIEYYYLNTQFGMMGPIHARRTK